MNIKQIPTAMLLVTLMTGCGGRGPAKQVEQPAKVTSEDWGKLGTGQAVELYTLRSATGAEATITTYGARVVTLKMPDKAGKFGDIVLVSRAE